MRDGLFDDVVRVAFIALLLAVAYAAGYNIGEGDGYCHAKYANNPAVCDVP